MKRLVLGILLSAVLVGIAGDISASFSDVETGTDNAVQAGTLDILPGRARWWGNHDAMKPCDFAVFKIEMENAGTLPLDYEVETSVSGDLARVVRVYVLGSSGHLDVGAHGLIKVYVVLPCRRGFGHRGESGSLEVTAHGTNAGLSDQEIWLSDFSTAED